MASQLFVSRVGSRIWAILREDGRLAMVRIEDAREPPVAGRVVKAVVTKVVPGLQCAFVDVGLDRDAYLEAAELALPGESVGEAGGAPIEDRLREGRDLLVQVEREPLRSKGARVTCRIALPGRYLVYLPNSSPGGISRRIAAPDERERLRGILDSLKAPTGDFIVRSAGEGSDAERFHADAAGLLETWGAVARDYPSAPAPSILHRDLDLPLRFLRDGPREGPQRVFVDDPEVYRRAAEHFREIAPDLAGRLRLHAGPATLFEAYGLEAQIRKVFRPKVWLKSGGHLIIEETEALVSIDVNTGKFTGGRLPRDTVLATNLEAVREVARQLRLRDLGGIIVVDLIHMARAADRREVLAQLESALGRDRARTKVLGMSELGLVELTRKHSRPGPEAWLTARCPACAGQGRIKSPPTVACEALAELRRILPRLDGRDVTVRSHPDVAPEIDAVLLGPDSGLGEHVRRRIRVVSDPSLRPDQFDVLAL